MRTRYVPQNATPIEEPGLGIVYVYPAKTPLGGLRYGAVGYRPKALKASFHYTFKTDAELDKHIQGWFNARRQHQQSVAERREREFAGHQLKVGDIITNSWGYDQTNVDWYMVTRTSKNYVWLRPVCAELVTDEGVGPMSGRESLRLDENLKPIFTEKGKETKHRARGLNVTMKHGCGSKWEGEKMYSSWYA